MSVPVMVHKDKDLIGETTTIMIRTILGTIMEKLEVEDQEASTEIERMDSNRLPLPETDQEGIITTNKRRLRHRLHISKN